MRQSGFDVGAIEMQLAMDGLGTALHDRDTQVILNTLHRALAKVELELPVAARGAFIPAGNAFDAVTAVAKILQEAKMEALFIDPYLGPKSLQTFALLAPEGVHIRLLAAKGRMKSGLPPLAMAWVSNTE